MFITALLVIIATLFIPTLYFSIQQAYTRSHMSTLFIIRGLPGSGKSTLARQMAFEKRIPHHYEADMYFTDEAGNYKWEASRIGEAHDWCFDKVHSAIMKGESVIVSNTFTRWREMREYVELALEHDFSVHIIHCVGDFGSIHGVPPETLEKMRARMLANADLPQMKGIIYSENIPVAEVASTVSP